MVGTMVRFINAEQHESYPQYYPKVGTLGLIINEDRDYFVKWEDGTTSGDDCWYAEKDWVEVVEAQNENH